MTEQQVVTVDKPNWIVNILSLCCIPILGVILYFVWKGEKPSAAKSALIFGLAGFAIVIISVILVSSLSILPALLSL